VALWSYVFYARSIKVMLIADDDKKEIDEKQR